jgi:Raf kinase inhibitor-like YbhB/YbcL family protein
MRVHTSAFGSGSVLPAEYSQRGGNTKPKFSVEDVPPAAKSLALVFYDLDKGGGSWCHWVKWNIPPNVRELTGGTEGTNSTGNKGYSGPAPDLDSGIHRYVFKFYALNKVLKLSPSAGKPEFDGAVSGHAIEEIEMRVRFGRPKPMKREKHKVNW